MKKRTLIIVLCILAIAMVLALTVESLFWIIMPLIPATILFYLAAIFSKSKWVSVIISLACIPMLYSGAEIYLSIGEPNHILLDVSSESKYIAMNKTPHVHEYNKTSDPFLGFTSKQMKVKTAHKVMCRDEEVFDVLYSWDEKGKRVTPDNRATAKNLVILLGCSFTFGHGLEDREAFAWQLAELLGSNFQVENYGYPGYGSHQMLALLESDRLDYLKDRYDNVYAFYLTFPEIEERGAGRNFWNYVGPKYVLNNEGELKYDGQFNITFHKSIFGKSKLLGAIRAKYTKHVLKDDMLDLHAATILKSKEMFRENLGGDFVTVSYPKNESLIERLEKGNMEVIDLSINLEGYDPGNAKYIIKHDGHPNAYSTKIIARVLNEHLVKKIK